MLRVVILSCILVAVCGMQTSMYGKGGTYGGYGSKGGFYGYGGNGGSYRGYDIKGGYYSGYGGKGSYYRGNGDKGSYYRGNGDKDEKDDEDKVKHNSQTIISLSSPSLPSFTLEGRNNDSPYGSGLGIIAAFGAMAFLFALTRN